VTPPTCEKFGVGCWVCRLADGADNEKGSFGNCAVRRPQKARLMKHRASEHHKRSVNNFLHQVGLADAKGLVPAPPLDEFAMLLTRIRKGELEATVRGKRRLMTTMSWCLYEAQREKNVNFLPMPSA